MGGCSSKTNNTSPADGVSSADARTREVEHYDAENAGGVTMFNTHSEYGYSKHINNGNDVQNDNRQQQQQHQDRHTGAVVGGQSSMPQLHFFNKGHTINNSNNIQTGSNNNSADGDAGGLIILPNKTSHQQASHDGVSPNNGSNNNANAAVVTFPKYPVVDPTITDRTATTGSQTTLSPNAVRVTDEQFVGMPVFNKNSSEGDTDVDAAFLGSGGVDGDQKYFKSHPENRMYHLNPNNNNTLLTTLSSPSQDTLDGLGSLPMTPRYGSNNNNTIISHNNRSSSNGIGTNLGGVAMVSAPVIVQPVIVQQQTEQQQQQKELEELHREQQRQQQERLQHQQVAHAQSKLTTAEMRLLEAQMLLKDIQQNPHSSSTNNTHGSAKTLGFWDRQQQQQQHQQSQRSGSAAGSTVPAVMPQYLEQQAIKAQILTPYANKAKNRSHRANSAAYAMRSDSPGFALMGLNMSRSGSPNQHHSYAGASSRSSSLQSPRLHYNNPSAGGAAVVTTGGLPLPPTKRSNSTFFMDLNEKKQRERSATPMMLRQEQQRHQSMQQTNPLTSAQYGGPPKQPFSFHPADFDDL